MTFQKPGKSCGLPCFPHSDAHAHIYRSLVVRFCIPVLVFAHSASDSVCPMTGTRAVTFRWAANQQFALFSKARPTLRDCSAIYGGAHVFSQLLRHNDDKVACWRWHRHLTLRSSLAKTFQQNHSEICTRLISLSGFHQLLYLNSCFRSAIACSSEVLGTGALICRGK